MTQSMATNVKYTLVHLLCSEKPGMLEAFTVMDPSPV